MNAIVHDYQECCQSLLTLKDRLSVDLVVLACASEASASLKSLVIRNCSARGGGLACHCDTGDAFRRAITTNAAVKEVNQRTEIPCLERHEPIRQTVVNSYLSIPVCDPGGSAVASLTVASHLPRIWSRREMEDLFFVSVMLRSMLLNAHSGSWHRAIVKAH